MGESYDQKDAAGFIRILGLPSRSMAMKKQQQKKTSSSQKTEEVTR
jgi:hypothetical protein